MLENNRSYVSIDSAILNGMTLQYQRTKEALDYEKRMAKGRDTFYASLVIAIFGMVLAIPEIAHLLNQ